MNSVATQEKRFVRLAPSNNATVFSPVGAQPVVRFSIADAQAFLLSKDVRLNFKLRTVRTGADTSVGITDDFNIDPVVGACGIMDQVIISSRRYGTTLEQINNMSRLDSSFYRSRFSPKQMGSNYYSETGAVGLGRYNAFEGGNQASATRTDLQLKAIRKKLIGTGAEVTDPSTEDLPAFSLPIHAGMFMSDDIDLSAVGGLELAIFLQKPEFLFFGTGTNAPGSASKYEIYDVSLTCPLLYKTAQEVAQTPPENELSFLNWTSLFSVLDSTSSSIAQRVFFSGLVSGIHNMLPTAEINSLTSNCCALKDVGVERLTFLRDGQRNPLEKTAITDRSSGVAVEQSPSLSSEVLQDYLSAFLTPRDLKMSQVIPQNLKGVANRSGVFGLGCNYAPDSGGINVSGVLGVDVVSKLEDVATGATTEPYALFSFYLSRQSYLTSPQGIRSI
jgi:hypothetical protein